MEMLSNIVQFIGALILFFIASLWVLLPMAALGFLIWFLVSLFIPAPYSEYVVIGIFVLFVFGMLKSK
ncbi:hypothetical protein [Helicobacter pullorum]|uniref:hypothetical protein n=1 Tax=Helicobacter pullorum TaxID=35818 RepID=UPI00242F6A73|nr:hypothetical protein [Helicobacter pullorum]